MLYMLCMSHVNAPLCTYFAHTARRCLRRVVIAAEERRCHGCGLRGGCGGNARNAPATMRACVSMCLTEKHSGGQASARKVGVRAGVGLACGCGRGCKRPPAAERIAAPAAKGKEG